MSLRPSSTRLTLNWKVFTQEGPRSWRLVLPRYYANLFEATLPSVLRKATAGFRDSSSKKTRVAFFPDLDDQELSRIQAFLACYERSLCLSTNRHLDEFFADELDFCIALDKNAPKPGADRTEIGEWRHRAKYSQDEEASTRLATELCRAIRMLPFATMPRPRLLCYVPSDPGKQFCLPAELARRVLAGTSKTFWDLTNPLVTPILTMSKQPAKDLTVAQKIAHWEKLIEAKAIKLSRSVKDCSVVVLDDLYQSGASLWSFAKYLKGRQAAVVVGLACVKSLRDTDNK